MIAKYDIVVKKRNALKTFMAPSQDKQKIGHIVLDDKQLLPPLDAILCMGSSRSQFCSRNRKDFRVYTNIVQGKDLDK